MDVLEQDDSSVILCQQCQHDGSLVPAEGFCENCDILICSSCIKKHQKLEITENHLIKFKDDIQKFLAHGDLSSELCDVHENEIVRFYCKLHDSVGCRDCILLKHSSCEIQLVSYVSRNFDDSENLVLIKHRINHVKKNLSSCKEEIKDSLKAASEIKADIIKEIKMFRKEIDTYLNKMEADLLKQVHEVNISDVSSQRKLLEQCETLIDEIEGYQSNLEQCKDKVNNLFVTSKCIQERIQKYHELNEEISSKFQINSFKFTASEEINALKKHKACLGNLSMQQKKFSGQSQETIFDKEERIVHKLNMQTKNEKACFITGVTNISEDEVLCADNNNKSLKVVNHRNYKVTTVFKTTSCPWDVTKINSSCAATTLPSESKILFLNMQSGLSESHKVDVRKGCMGIDHQNDIIAVSFVEPPAVQVLDINGQILHEVSGTGVLEFPQYVCFSTNNQRIFVSDSDNNALYEFTLKQHIKAVNKAGDMGPPFGLTVTNCDSILVCYPSKSEMVGVIVPGSTKILHFYLQGAIEPMSIIVSEQQRRIIISESNDSKDRNFLKIVELK